MYDPHESPADHTRNHPGHTIILRAGDAPSCTHGDYPPDVAWPRGTTAQCFRCPRCGRRSYHPRDLDEGWCGHCHDWTDRSLTPLIADGC